MSYSLTLQNSIVSHAAPRVVSIYPLFFYDRNGKLIFRLAPGEVKGPVTAVVSTLRLFNMPTAMQYTFPKNVTLNPGQAIVFSDIFLKLGDSVTVWSQGKQVDAFNMDDSGPTLDAMHDATHLIKNDTYWNKVLALAKMHAVMGSTRKQFNADLKQRNLTDDTPTKKLTKDQFDYTAKTTATVQLTGKDSAEDDQTIYDESAMLFTAVNTRLGAIANAAHPDPWDVSKPEVRLQMLNYLANNMFNFYYQKLGSFETSVNMSTQNMSEKYNTATIELDAIKSLFKSLAFPEDQLAQLLSFVDTFVTDMRNLSASSSTDGMKNAKLVDFTSIQPPPDNPTLKKVATKRMLYVQFNEETSQWSNSCSHGSSYQLDTGLFELDVELNRQVVHLTYDHNVELTVANAEASLDEILGTAKPDVKIDTKKQQPIGPPSIPPP